MSDLSSVQPHYAVPWKRLAAFVIDLPFLFVLTAAARAVAGPHAGLECVLACWLYYAGLECSTWQATPGKKVLGLRVTDSQGERLNFLKTSLRYGAKLISVVSLGAGFALMFLTEKRQAFHDYAAGCVVLDGRPQQQPGA